MTPEQVIGLLWKGSHEFRGRSMEEIADLNDDQIDMLMRADPRPRKKSGGGYVSGSYPVLTREHFFETWRGCGKDDAWIEAEWQRDYGDLPGA